MCGHNIRHDGLDIRVRPSPVAVLSVGHGARIIRPDRPVVLYIYVRQFSAAEWVVGAEGRLSIYAARLPGPTGQLPDRAE
ncbi:hypothetical protein AA12717_0568 [Gluconacetobacter sacchari DSM 12717]|uniref:Uncharacterized protein n=1 Tax=Gluconacetobacter sacchari DSM 12717 TaxID=1307940 RepID=A0ABQ0P339_9PROT|nr:hypothetical protein AA12717_0568 [Gluconacetobacter sacchari DSM 12717]